MQSDTHNKPLYLVEFPDFGALPFDPTRYGLEDTSWHNDTCPSFSVMNAQKDERIESLWIDHADPALRDFEGKRFTYCVYRPDSSEVKETLLETDDPDAALSFLRDRSELLDALEAAAAYVELYTGAGVRKQPPARYITGNGDFDAEAIARDARAALAKVGR